MADAPLLSPHHIPTPPHDLPRTLGDLRASGWESVPVAEELRRNASARDRGGAPR